jgi:hypothetical protein
MAKGTFKRKVFLKRTQYNLFTVIYTIEYLNTGGIGQKCETWAHVSNGSKHTSVEV